MAETLQSFSSLVKMPPRWLICNFLKGPRSPSLPHHHHHRYSKSKDQLAQSRNVQFSSQASTSEPFPSITSSTVCSLATTSKMTASLDAHNSDKSVPTIYHTVRKGETLTSIAKKFGITVEQISMANKIKDVNIIREGQILAVPVNCEISGKNLDAASIFFHNVYNEDIFVKGASTSTLSMPFLSPSVLLSVGQVKASMAFFLLLPLVILFTRSLMNYGYRKNEIDQPIKKNSLARQQKLKNPRWRGILDDGYYDEESRGREISPSNNYNQLDIDERTGTEGSKAMRQSYAELESQYTKFLGECGLSKTGYWRGGVPDLTTDENAINFP